MNLTKTLLPALFVLCAAAAHAADPQTPTGTDTCVDVRIGNDRTAYLNCLNQQLKERAEHEQNAPPIAAPIDSQSSPSQVGVATDAAAREKMGSSFGTSATPQRPTTTFATPLVPSGH